MAMSADEIKKDSASRLNSLTNGRRMPLPASCMENLAGRLRTAPAALLCSMRK